MINKTTIIGASIIVIFTSCAIQAQDPRKLIVPDEYASIKAAMEKAVSGDTVFVKSGVYEEDEIRLPDGVKLIGEGMDKVTIQNSAASGRHIIISSKPNGLIKGLTIEQIGTSESKSQLAGIRLMYSSAEVAECRIRNISGNGIEIMIGGKPFVHDCIIELNRNCGILARGERSDPIIRNNICSDNQNGIVVAEEGTNATLTNNQFRGNRVFGIYIRQDANAVVENNICEKNTRTGIAVYQKGTTATLKGNQCRENGEGGILFTEAAEGLAENNICEKNTRTGIAVYQKGTTATLKGNRCLENGEDGICFNETAKGLAENNICKANGRSGIYVYREEAETTLTNNQCLENKGNGIWLATQCRGTVRDNLCKGNANNGISLIYKGVSPRLIGNRCLENGGSGIYFSKEASGTAEGNICKGNQWAGIAVADVWTLPVLNNNTCLENVKESVYYDQGEFGHVRLLLAEEKFEEIEQIASRLREQKARSYSGGWQLSYYYSLLCDSCTPTESSKKEWFFGVIDRWIKSKPESITPRIVLAYAYSALAWEGRGEGWASEVTPEGWKIFEDNLTKAQDVLQKAEKLQGKDQELYVAFISVGFALGKSQFEMESPFLKGIAIERNYHELYLTMANYLQPKWHGVEGELEAFADRAAHLTKEQEGESLYAIVAQVAIPKSKTANPDDFLNFKFSYDRIKQGFEDILQRYPKADYYLNCYCFIASINKDKETAVRLFDKIGNDYNRYAWCSNDNFQKYRDWAYSGQVKGEN